MQEPPKPKLKSWYFDPETKPTERQKALSEGQPYQLLEATELDKQKVVEFYQHGPVDGYEIGSVEVIYNKTFNTKFHEHLKTLQWKKESKAFEPKWKEMSNPDLREKTYNLFEVMSKASYRDDDYPDVKLIPAWHGTRQDTLEGIFKIGYSALATTDMGYFGKGIYSAYEAEYPYRVYAKRYGKTGALILNWVAIFSPLPVINNGEFKPQKGLKPERQGDMCILMGKGNYANYDAHFAPVVPKNPLNEEETEYSPWKGEGKDKEYVYIWKGKECSYTYTEIVVFEAAACLPRYLVRLRRPPSPETRLIEQQTKERQLQLIKEQKLKEQQREEQRLKEEELKLKEEQLKKQQMKEQRQKEQELKEQQLKAQTIELEESKFKLTQVEKDLQAAQDEVSHLQRQLQAYQNRPALSPEKISGNPFITFQPEKAANKPSLKLEMMKQELEQNQQNLELLFKWVTEGHLLEVERLLQKNPNLAFIKGTIKDLSERTFENTSAFQYAAWALDIEMCKLMIKYFDRAGAVAADIQLTELEANPGPHGAHYNIGALVKKMQEYLNNYNSRWDANKCCQYWQNEVGGEQRKCPAWLIYAWCEGGENVAWVKKDLKDAKVIRQYEKGHIAWWFGHKSNLGCGVGSEWAAVRGNKIAPWSCRGITVSFYYVSGSEYYDAQHDRDVCQSVSVNCREALTSLKANLEKNHTQEKQNPLIEALLKGDFELAKKLESQGASFLYMDKNEIYPLAAAVYGCNLELVRYIEEKLKGEVTEQWQKVDPAKANDKIDSQMPTELSKTPTYGELGNWYIKHDGALWCGMYDMKVLKGMSCTQWDDGDGSWGRSGRAGWLSENAEEIWVSDETATDIFVGKGLGLYAPSIKVHQDVVKVICEQLNELRSMVKINTNQNKNCVTM